MVGMGMHRINGFTYDLNRIDETVPFNELEEWSIQNFTDEFHPMHVHGILFQVLSRDGSTTLPPSDKGWKDTVLVHPQGRASILIKFADYAGRYLLHCHNLEHEDEGMMLNFRVSNPTGVHNERSPASFALHQNYPNPFTRSQPTTITFELMERSHVPRSVHEAHRRIVLRLVDEFKEAGHHSVLINEMKFQKQPLATGMYFAKMRVGRVEKMIKMVVRD